MRSISLTAESAPSIRSLHASNLALNRMPLSCTANIELSCSLTWNSIFLQIVFFQFIFDKKFFFVNYFFSIYFFYQKIFFIYWRSCKCATVANAQHFSFELNYSNLLIFSQIICIHIDRFFHPLFK